MFPEEKELRRELARRTFRSGVDVWPAVRPKLDTEVSRGRAAAWPTILAVLLVIVLLVALRGRSERAERRRSGEDFGVANARSLGQPATPIVLRPDPNTLMIVVD